MLSRAASSAVAAARGARAASTISKIVGREIIDSRGNPTVEADVFTSDGGMYRAAVPSGASTGIFEAVELRDADKSVFGGKGVRKAVGNVNSVLSPKLVGFDVTQQKKVDAAMIEIDGTPNKAKLGANAILAVSLAVAKAGAGAKKVPLWQHFADLGGKSQVVLPVPSFNVINGGEHAGNGLAFQEFMILPTGVPTFREAMRAGCEVFHALKAVIKKKYGQDAVNVGDEGGFAPSITSAEDGLQLLSEAIEKAGYTGKVVIGMDVAASEFATDEAPKRYDLGKKAPKRDYKSGEEMLAFYKSMVSKYPIVSIEDPYEQEDWSRWAAITAALGDKAQIVGDDLLCTNPARVATAVKQKACNALLLKVNQIGSVSESIQAVLDAQAAGWGVMTSHRSGETEDTTIADLAVGLATGQIKTGAPCRSERLAKYNQLLRIEEELGAKAVYAGAKFRKPF